MSSPAPALPALHLLRPPSAARLAVGDPDDALAALVATRVAHAEAAGRLDGRERTLRELAQPVEQLVAALEADARASVDQMARFCADLALGIVRELLGTELAGGRYDLEALVRRSLGASLAERRPVEVHLCPEDAARLAEVPFSAGTKLVPDPSLPRGSLFIDGPQGRLVRSLDERLAAIEEALAAEYPA
jgi:flagellar biosynthesis/type III secretory pathway protein FliH